MFIKRGSEHNMHLIPCVWLLLGGIIALHAAPPQASFCCFCVRQRHTARPSLTLNIVTICSSSAVKQAWRGPAGPLPSARRRLSFCKPRSEQILCVCVRVSLRTQFLAQGTLHNEWCSTEQERGLTRPPCFAAQR